MRSAASSRPHRRIGAVLLLLSLPLALQGCWLIFKRPYTDFDDFTPSSPALADYLIREINSRSQNDRSLRAFGKLTVRRGDVRQKFSEVLVFERPERLRVELFVSELNRLTALLTVSGERLFAQDVNSGQAYTGSATPENLTQLLRVPFTPEELMLWSIGRFVVRRSSLVAYGASTDTSGNRKILQLLMKDDREIIMQISQADGRPACSEICIDSIEVRSGRPKRTLFFSKFDYQAADRDGLAINRTFELPQLGVEGELVFDEFERNPDLSATRNRLFSPPPGAGPAVDLDRLEGSDSWSLF